MKRVFLTALTIIGFAAPAFAQDTAALCRLMGAGGPMVTAAAYQPGVDAHGKPVVPADLNAGIGGDADTIKIPLSIDLARRLHVPRGAEMETSAGTLEIHKDGTVTAGGQDLTSQSHAICGLPDVTPPAPEQKIAAPVKPDVPAPVVPKVAAPAPLPVPARPHVDADPKSYIPPAGSVSAYVEPHGADKRPDENLRQGDVVKGDVNQKPSTHDDIIWGQGN